MSKSDYAVSTVHYNNLDAGQHTTKGKSYKSFQLAVSDFNLLWDTTNAYVGNIDKIKDVIRHLVCSLKHYKYNEDAKHLLKNIYLLAVAQSYDLTSDGLDCASTKLLLNSSEDYYF
tara:strand:+ start:20 stop:367 length:348 start_codon:yes stop_codon:yes gene_type:complete